MSTSRDNNVLIRCEEALGIGWSRNIYLLIAKKVAAPGRQEAGSVLMVNRPMNKSEGRINRMGADVPDQAERSGAGRVLW